MRRSELDRACRRAGEERRIWVALADLEWRPTRALARQTGMGWRTLHRRLAGMMMGEWPIEKRKVGFWVEWRRTGD